MEFRRLHVNYYREITAKIIRFYAYKYEVQKSEVVLMITGNITHILIAGKLKESIHPEALEGMAIDEKTLTIKKRTTKL